MMLSEHSRLLQKFDTCRTAFVLCDVQEKVENSIANFQHAVHVANTMASLHELLGPERSVFLATEQYPPGLGHVHHGVRLPKDAVVAEKIQGSVLVPAVRAHIFGDAERGIPPVQQVIIWGHETYGCILQSIDELLTHGMRVAVLVDGCASQQPAMHHRAIEQMSHWDGLLLSTTPSAIMQLTRSDVRYLKPIIQILKRFDAEWQSTPSKPEGGVGEGAVSVRPPEA